MRRIGLFAGLLGLFLYARARAVDFKIHEVVGAYLVNSYRLTAIGSATASGYMMSWSVLTTSGTADFKISYSTMSNDLAVNSSSSVITSSTIFALSGIPMGDTVPSLVANPVFFISRLDSGTSVYLDITTIIPRQAGEY